mgnify:CR=1 FL=1
MKITIIGTGYIGLVQGAMLSDLGFDVTCFDIDSSKIELLKKGISPIYEPGLEEIIKSSLTRKTISFSSSCEESVKNADIIFIGVGTPPLPDGSTDLSYIESAAGCLGNSLKDGCLVITKSTVPIGTNRKIRAIIQRKLDSYNRKISFSVISNPEFLREGKAVYDCYNPERIVIGIDAGDNRDLIKKKIEEIYDYFIEKNIPLVFTTLESAELAKYASDVFLAMKISYINEIALLSEKLDANVNDVARIMGLDSRIGKDFLKAGLGFGGSCFPKDTLSLLNIAKDNGSDLGIVDAAVKTNEHMKEYLLSKIISKSGDIQGKEIAVLGLSFKPDTDDIRESPSIGLIRRIVSAGGHVRVYCPKAMENSKKVMEDIKDFITFTENEYECAKNADLIILATEWEQFRELDFTKIRNSMCSNYFFDLRNMFIHSENVKKLFKYYPVGIN